MWREALAISPKQVAKLLLLTLLMALALGTIYQAANAIISPSWLAAAFVHTSLAVVIVLVASRHGALGSVFAIGGWRGYLPAIALAAGALLLAAGSRFYSGSPGMASVGVEPAWILWVPIIEEIVFRFGVGSSFRRSIGLGPGLGSVIWAGWFSALVFAMAHSAPTFERFLAGEVGVPLGPFLLGITCEVIFVRTGQILPAIAFHAVANATPIILSALDARWLDWLGFLYQ